MRRPTFYKAWSMMGLILALLPGCKSEYKGLWTVDVLTQVDRAIWFSTKRTGHGVVPEQPSRISSIEELNAHITKTLITEKHIVHSVFWENGYLGLTQTGRPILVDSWGRPLMFSIPELYPSGLTYTSSGGRSRILPLPSSVWPPQKGPVQVWSLGPDGQDDRGEGDDILPQS